MNYSMEQIEALKLSAIGLINNRVPYQTKILVSKTEGYFIIYESRIFKVELDAEPTSNPNGFYYRRSNNGYVFFFGYNEITNITPRQSVPLDTMVWKNNGIEQVIHKIEPLKKNKKTYNTFFDTTIKAWGVISSIILMLGFSLLIVIPILIIGLVILLVIHNG